MTLGTNEREVSIIGQQDKQEQALQLVLAELTWARGVDGLLKGPTPEEEAALREKEQKQQEEKQRRRELAKEMKAKENGAARKSGKPGASAWVCGSCGQNHRTKDCPMTKLN